MTSILVVDDSRLARNMVSSVIASLRPDWTIVTAASGEEALEIVGEVPPAAAIVDYNMPGMDGLALAERLKERFDGLTIGLLTANVQDALRRKELHRLDLAFSRDQDRKVYVQDRLRERGRELYDWLEGGAHLYVCGAIAMGKDVHAALLGIVAGHLGGDAEAAADYLVRLQAEGRYARDVY